MMPGDCSPCDHSLAARCTQGDDGREFMHSDKPLPCPLWDARGEKWERENAALAKRNHWPFRR